MKSEVRCISCNNPLTKIVYHGKNWHRCLKCTSALVPLQAFKQVLSQYEFNKFEHEFKFEKIKSSVQCPVCKKIMGKVLDLVNTNDVEICAACRLVWLGPGEGEKIRFDQVQLSQTEKKTNLNTIETYESFYSLAVFRPLAKNNPVIASFLSILIAGVITALVLLFLYLYLKRH